MRPVPYIGITGVTTNAQYKEVMKARRPIWYPYIMAGILVSDKTLSGELAKWPARNPSVSALSTIFEPYAHAINLVHYHTRDQETLLEQMEEVDRLVGDHSDGFQLNVTWPDPRIIEKYLARSISLWSKRTIVLQCGRRALEKYDRDPKKIARAVYDDYVGLADYVLIDPSGGKGEEYDHKFAFECLMELFGVSRHIGPGIAGGLSPENVEDKLRLLWQDLPEPFSIDAEGRLRDSSDQLDITKCKAYVEKASMFYPAG